MDFTYQPVERYRAIMALLFYFKKGMEQTVCSSNLQLQVFFAQGHEES